MSCDRCLIDHEPTDCPSVAPVGVKTVVVPAPTRPMALPRCEHGGRPGWCSDCQKRDQEINARVKPLADEFWESRGGRDLEWLLLRAYRMGMNHSS